MAKKKTRFKRVYFTHQHPGGAFAHAPITEKLPVVEVEVHEYNEYALTVFKKDLKEVVFKPEFNYWVHLVHPKENEALRVLCALFKVHNMHIEDVMELGQRGKYEHTPNYEFLIVNQLAYATEYEAVSQEQLAIFKFNNIIITIHEDDSDVLNMVRQRIENPQSRIRKLGLDYLIFAFLDAIVDHYFPTLRAISDKIDEIEDKVFRGEADKPILAKLYQAKRDLLLLRRHIWPMRELLNTFIQESTIKESIHPFLRDIYQQTIEVLDITENLRESVSSILDIHLSNTAQRTNEIMKFMTVFSSIFIPVTFIAGVYGMNFKEMPELKTKYGYYFVWAIMLSSIIGLLIMFRRRRWI